LQTEFDIILKTSHAIINENESWNFYGSIKGPE
jgi:hypothetical protein